MKIIVHSISPKHGLLNSDGNFLPPGRPCVAWVTPLVEQRLAKGDFRLLVGNLDDSATDAEFKKFLAESQGEDPKQAEQLALDSFESVYSLEALRRKSTEAEESEEEKAARVQALQDAALAEKTGQEDAAAALLSTAVDETPPGEAAAGSKNTTTPASNKR